MQRCFEIGATVCDAGGLSAQANCADAFFRISSAMRNSLFSCSSSLILAQSAQAVQTLDSVKPPRCSKTFINLESARPNCIHSGRTPVLQLQPLVVPQVAQCVQDPLRRRVKLPHSPHGSPS